MIMEKNNKKEVGLIDYSKQGRHHWGGGRGAGGVQPPPPASNFVVAMRSGIFR